MTRPVRDVLLPKFEELTGYTEQAVRKKIAKGQWVEGIHFNKAPDGHILIDLEAYELWVRGANLSGSKSTAERSALCSSTAGSGAGKH